MSQIVYYRLVQYKLKTDYVGTNLTPNKFLGRMDIMLSKSEPLYGTTIPIHEQSSHPYDQHLHNYLSGELCNTNQCFLVRVLPTSLTLIGGNEFRVAEIFH
jgi:hypothetical protein